MHRLKSFAFKKDSLDGLFLKLNNIEDIFPHLSDTQLKSLVGLAGLLSFVALADDQCLCPNEEKEIYSIISTVFSINDIEAKKIVKFLKILIPYLSENGDDYFCRLINDSCNENQREAVVGFLNRVAAADQSTTRKQLASIYEIARLLGVSVPRG